MNLQVCSGKGDCICDKCICNKNNNKNETYLGDYCDYCEDCLEQRCQELNKYISRTCKVVEKLVKCNDTDGHDIIMVDKNNIVSYHKAKWCSINSVKDDCAIVYKFKYHVLDKRLILIVQDEMDCPPKANIWSKYHLYNTFGIL